MPLPVIHIWKKAPFLRLLFPFIAGIVLQWHLQTDIKILWIILVISLLAVLGFFLIPFFEKYKLSAISGLAIMTLFISVGGLLAWYKNIKHNESWFGKKYIVDDGMILTLLENPVEKTKSYKANASVDYLVLKDSAIKTNGTIIVYFKKDSSVSKLEYGSKIVISKSLQEIKNSGNPGGFDYKRYSLFQGITHQVYLKEDEFEILPGENKTRFNEFIFDSRKKVLNILRKNIKGEKELGLAEALLIGYKDDLDKTLVQSYSNTGVVHVIAISGLHLGLIYWLLLRATFLLNKRKNLKWLRPVLIIAGLWLFSFLAGAQPSIVRSAVMFTCIVGAEWISRKSSIYNTLAFSAFLLLCYNPYWLWDVGFQLSYTAVLSIVIFMQPIYNWFYIKNKALYFLWKLNAVTLAAQILTLPVSIYHFHQFPNYFLFTNFIAVPLSSLILIGEIFLCAISFIPLVAAFTGKILSWLIWIMNTYVERIEMLPYALLDGLRISIVQAIFLLASVAGFGYWLLEKNKMGWKYGLAALLIFFGIRSVSFIKANNQQKLIVYNVPQKQAIDIIDGRNYLFVGDTDLLADDFVRNFHIKPARVLNRVEEGQVLKNYFQSENLIQYNNKKILLVDNNSTFMALPDKIPVDLLVVSKNPKLYFKKLVETFSIKQVVFDGSVPSWKMAYWKNDCDSLRIPYYDVSEKGAFVMNLR
jgi:competence protein ComEC